MSKVSRQPPEGGRSPKPGKSILKPGPLSYKRKVLEQLLLESGAATDEAEREPSTEKIDDGDGKKVDQQSNEARKRIKIKSDGSVTIISCDNRSEGDGDRLEEDGRSGSSDDKIILVKAHTVHIHNHFYRKS
ncbi:unnamed protein product [Phyllotreta striolata]|uniref:Uncharacterized protein n=1 Tax=Phyllotreta striolata TaxID=444603 RepID=A0A9N9TT33_PHYSR|nr:unnamed protein product [Phyllotreta striolata]